MRLDTKQNLSTSPASDAVASTPNPRAAKRKSKPSTGQVNACAVKLDKLIPGGTSHDVVTEKLEEMLIDFQAKD